jgi:hypothetical protein
MKNKSPNKQTANPKPNPEEEQRILEHIRKRAYELWEASGCQQGNDHANWIEAEREVRIKMGQH